MLNIISYQGDSYFNHNEIQLHIHQDGYNNKRQIISGYGDIDTQTQAADGNVKGCNYFGKQYGNFSND